MLEVSAPSGAFSATHIGQGITATACCPDTAPDASSMALKVTVAGVPSTRFTVRPAGIQPTEYRADGENLPTSSRSHSPESPIIPVLSP